MSAEQPVIRTYRARERSEAEEAYRLDAETAEQQHWYPVAHRWSSSWAGEELSVVFEHRPDGGDGVTPPDEAPSPEPEAVATEPVEAVAEPEGAVEAAEGSETDEPEAQPEQTLYEPVAETAVTAEPAEEVALAEPAEPEAGVPEAMAAESESPLETEAGPEDQVWAPEPEAVASESEAAATSAESEPEATTEADSTEDQVWAPEPEAIASEPEATEGSAEAAEADSTAYEVWAPEPEAVASEHEGGATSAEPEPEGGADSADADGTERTESAWWYEPPVAAEATEVAEPTEAAATDEAELPEMGAAETEVVEPTEAAAAAAEHEAQVEAEHEAQASGETEESESSGESLSAADEDSPWTEYDSSPADAPEDALAREEPWVASALVDEHEPGYMSVAATAIAAQMQDDWSTTLPTEHDEVEAAAEPQPEPEPEATAEPETTAEPEAATALSTDDQAAWIATAGVAQATSSRSFDATGPSEPMAASMPAVRAHARALVQAIDLHTAGEPLRLIRSGFPSVPSAPILERRAWLRDHLDFARQVLMWEPRGHRDMYGAILLPPYAADADISVLFMHNEGYSTMCGHGIIAITTALIEEGLYPATTPETEIRFETPAGIVTATASVSRTGDGRHEVNSVRFQNVPSYLHERDIQVRPDGIQLGGAAAEHGSVLVDIAFGGAYYGVVNAADLGLRVVPEHTEALTRAGAAITDALRRDHTPTHPTEADLGFVYGTIIVDDDPASAPDGRSGHADLRNVTIFADAEVDRSPCGSGTSALLARLHALGQLETGTQIVNAGITGEAFRAWVDSDTQIGDRAAVLTSVEGNAYVTGYHTFVIDDRDPLGNGFLLR